MSLLSILGLGKSAVSGANREVSPPAGTARAMTSENTGSAQPTSEQASDSDGRSFDDEALQAYELLEQAMTAKTLEETVPHLRSWHDLTSRSPYHENYEPGVLDEILGEQVLFLARLRGKNLDGLTLKEEISEIRKVCRELPGMVPEEAFPYSVSAVEERAVRLAYQPKLLRRAMQVMEAPDGEVLTLLAEYEQFREYCREVAGDFVLPALPINPARGFPAERDSDWAVYRRGMDLLLRTMAKELETLDSLVLEREDYLQSFNQRAALAASFNLSCSKSAGEVQPGLLSLLSLCEQLQEKVKYAHGLHQGIEDKNDELYEDFMGASRVGRAEILFDFLVNHTLQYSRVLGVTDLQPLLEEGKKKFASLGAVLEQEGNHYVINSPGGKYQLSLELAEMSEPAMPE